MDWFWRTVVVVEEEVWFDMMDVVVEEEVVDWIDEVVNVVMVEGWSC